MHNIKLGDCELSYEDVRLIELSQDCQIVCFGVSNVETLVFTTRVLVWEYVSYHSSENIVMILKEKTLDVIFL